MSNKLKLFMFWLFQMIFLFFVFFYVFQMNSLREQSLLIINGSQDENFISVMNGYLPIDMLQTGVIFVVFALMLTIASNFSISKGFKKMGVLLILLSTCYIAFLTYVDYKEDRYLVTASETFDKLYKETSSISQGTDKAIIENAKLYHDRYKSTPSADNKIKFKTAYQTLIFKMKELRTIKLEQIETFNNVLKLHVNYNVQQEKLLNTIQLYLVICLIFLALVRIRFGK